MADTVALNIILAGAFVDGLIDDEKVAFSKKHTQFKTRVGKHTLFMTKTAKNN